MMMAAGLRKSASHSLAELARVCALIELSPAGRAPDMAAIYRQVELERGAPVRTAAKLSAKPQPAKDVDDEAAALALSPEARSLALVKIALRRPMRIG